MENNDNNNIEVHYTEEDYINKIEELKKRMKNPLTMSAIFAFSVSLSLNLVANINDKYTLMEFLRHTMVGTVGNIPSASIIYFFVNELNNEKKEKIDELRNQINELKNKNENIKTLTRKK